MFRLEVVGLSGLGLRILRSIRYPNQEGWLLVFSSSLSSGLFIMAPGSTVGTIPLVFISSLPGAQTTFLTYIVRICLRLVIRGGGGC